jgi:hypothetical protein
VPQRDPLSPPLLTAAAVLAALLAAWIALAADAVVAGVAGKLAGFPWFGLSISPAFTLRPLQLLAGSHPPGLWAIALLAGPIGSALLGLAVHWMVEAVRSAAWLRVVVLEWVAFALLRLPSLLVAGIAPGGRGAVDDLYGRLGEPQTGRWSVALLALLALAGAAHVVARRAVAVGKGWMRVDGLEFRRRLVRVLVGYPSLAALAAWCALMPWATPVWMAGWLLLTLTSLHVLMS